jgi:DNA-binding LacI/PurR family transcriptional regulator
LRAAQQGVRRGFANAVEPVFAECLEGIAQAANQAGYAILPMTTDYLEREELAVQPLVGNVDGLVLVFLTQPAIIVLKRFRTHELPYVLAYNRHMIACLVDNNWRHAKSCQPHHCKYRRITLISGKLAIRIELSNASAGLCRHGSPRVGRLAVAGGAIC